MDPMRGAEEMDFTLSVLLRSAGPVGVLALLAGVIVLGLALRCASRCGPRSHAYALFAAAWFPILPLLGTESAGEIPLLIRATSQSSDPVRGEVARLLAGPMPEHATMLLCAAGLLLGLVGAVAALARSRSDFGGSVASALPA